MATAILTYLEAVSAAGLLAQADVQVAEAAKRRAAYDKAEAAYRRDRSHVTDDEIRRMQTHGTCGTLGMHSLLSAYKYWQDAERQARQLRELAAVTKPASARVRIAVTDAFAVKDALKAAGYRFDREGHWVDFLGLRVQSAWVKTLAADDGQELATALRHLSELGIALRPDVAINAMVRNLQYPQ